MRLKTVYNHITTSESSAGHQITHGINKVSNELKLNVQNKYISNKSGFMRHGHG